MIARGLRSRCPTPAQPVVQLLAPAVQLLQELPSHFLADGGDRVAKGRPVPVEVPPQGLRQPRRAEVAACRIGHGLPNPGEAHVGGPQLPRREALAEAGVPLSDWEDHDSDDALAAGFVELLDSIFVERCRPPVG